jgi:uncharacterized membrane protein YfcA
MFPESLGRKWSVVATLILLAWAGWLLNRASNDSLSPSADETSSRELSEAVEVNDGDLAPLFPMGTNDYIGFLAAIIALLLAAGGGIGGGGLLLPIFLLVMKFPVKHAVSLSNVTVFGGALASMLLNAGMFHPLAERPLIDWKLLAVMEPLTMAGALIGADLNQILPDVLVVVLLVLLLGYTAIRTLEKVGVCKGDAYKCRKESDPFLTVISNFSRTEQANEMHAAETAAMTNQETQPLMSTKTSTNATYGDEVVALHDVESLRSAELRAQLAKESHTDWSLIAKLAVLIFTVVFLNIVKGGGGSLLEWLPFEAVRCGSTVFYALEVAIIVMIVGFALHIRAQLITETQHKESIGYTFVKGDIQWDSSNTIYYSSICSVAGLFAGLFGIGGGIVKSPLMLQMGVHPLVASATCATMILFTSFTATTSFMVYGELDYDYGAAFLVVGFLSTLVGQLLMHALMKKYNRNSYIAYSVALVVGASVLAMTWSSILTIVSGNGRKGGGMCTSIV